MALPRLRLFGFRGISIRLDASWFAIAVLVTWSLAAQLFPAWHAGLPRATYWVMGIAGALGLFGSIVVHELSHALVARRHDIPIEGITLFVFGGVAEMGAEPPSPKAELTMALAGPLASIAIGLAAFAGSALAGGSSGGGVVATVLAYLGMVNLLLAAFNLVPAFPLDGGRVLRALLWRRRGSLVRATHIASRVGIAFSLALMVLGGLRVLLGDLLGGVWFFLIGMFLRRAADASYQQVVVRGALEHETVKKFMTVGPVSVRPDLTLAEFLDSYVYRYHHKLFPVQDNGRLLGLISTEQLRGVPRAEWPSRSVGAVTVPLSEAVTVTPDTAAMQALGRMRQTGRSRLLVVDDGKLAGILSVRDLLDFLALKVELEP
jgi:Zn-dependent protease/CBS domain-containing protein